MPVTQEKILSQTAWLRVATGAGDAVLTSHGPVQYWAITDSNVAPTLTKGHTCTLDENMSLTLIAGEHLWLKGSGLAAVTATTAVGDVI